MTRNSSDGRTDRCYNNIPELSLESAGIMISNMKYTRSTKKTTHSLETPKQNKKKYV